MQLMQIYEEKLLPDNDTLDAMSLFDDEIDEEMTFHHLREFLEEENEIN